MAMAMVQSRTEMVTSLSTMSQDEKDAELLWMTQIIETIRNLKDNPSRDCSVIVGETKIPVHRVVVELNSSLLTAGSVGFDEQNEVTEIEVAPEFDDKPDLVKSIVTSFYSGTIEIDEGVMKQVYKFSALYEIGWLKILSRRTIVNYLTKSMFGCYERFREVFTFAHSIWDIDMFESCIRVIDEYVLESLIKDIDMLEKVSFRCMEIITVSSNVGFSERNLFDLLVAWVTCKKQACKKNFQKLFENLKYELMDKDFIIGRVMPFVSQNEGIFSVTFLQTVLGGMTENSKDICRSNQHEQLKEDALRRVQILLTDLDSDKTRVEKLNDLNTFLIRSDIQYLSDEMKERVADELNTQEKLIGQGYVVATLDWVAVVNLINHCQDGTCTAELFREYILTQDYHFNNLDWTIVTEKAMIHALDYLDNYHGYYGEYSFAEIVMYWCLANRGTCDDATLKKIISRICYSGSGDVYNTHILLPTIKHLLSDTTKLACHHPGECKPQTHSLMRVPVNEKLYKLEPFENDVATLTDIDGVLEFEWSSGLWGGFMFKKDKPYEPHFPMCCFSVEEDALKRLIASLKDDDEIIAIVGQY